MQNRERILRPANLDRPSWQWSSRDWQVFKATSHVSDRVKALRDRVVSEYRSGRRVSEIAEPGKLSRQYVYLLLATQLRIDDFKMRRFYERRGNIGRPIDMGGPRNEWIDEDVFDAD